MPTTYEPIATVTVSSATASIIFSSIPATYTDLKIILVGTSSGNADPELTFNSDTSTNYSRTALGANGSSVSTTSDTNIPYILNRLTYFSSAQVVYQTFDIFSYTASMFKTVLCDGAASQNEGNGGVGKTVGLWRNTSAITSLRLFFASRTYSTGTTATLYGIKNA